ncbi:Histidine kinase A [Pelomyxa schiedti]|nr:Histidine kinase A [Pelomyxa schiedti]
MNRGTATATTTQQQMQQQQQQQPHQPQVDVRICRVKIMPWCHLVDPSCVGAVTAEVALVAPPSPPTPTPTAPSSPSPQPQPQPQPRPGGTAATTSSSSSSTATATSSSTSSPARQEQQPGTERGIMRLSHGSGFGPLWGAPRALTSAPAPAPAPATSRSTNASASCCNSAVEAVCAPTTTPSCCTSDAEASSVCGVGTTCSSATGSNATASDSVKANANANFNDNDNSNACGIDLERDEDYLAAVANVTAAARRWNGLAAWPNETNTSTAFSPEFVCTVSGASARLLILSVTVFYTKVHAPTLYLGSCVLTTPPRKVYCLGVNDNDLLHWSYVSLGTCINAKLLVRAISNNSVLQNNLSSRIDQIFSKEEPPLFCSPLPRYESVVSMSDVKDKHKSLQTSWDTTIGSDKPETISSPISSTTPPPAPANTTTPGNNYSYLPSLRRAPPANGSYEQGAPSANGNYEDSPLQGKLSLPVTQADRVSTPEAFMPHRHLVNQLTSLDDAPVLLPPSHLCNVSSDLNARFQSITERIHCLKFSEGKFDDKLGINQELSNLASDFIHIARMYGVIIINERYLPVSQKTVKPLSLGGIAGGDKYIVNNILFKFAVDRHGLFSDDWDAAKVAGHELKSLVNIYKEETYGLSLPLMALVDYRGFRLIAMTLLPITENTIVLGTSDAGQHFHTDEHVPSQILESLASKLNLVPHKINDALIFTCADTEGHIAPDNRFYLLDFSRTFPPEAPPSASKTRSHLFELLRPELVRQFSTPLCSDAWSRFMHDQENEAKLNHDVLCASEYLHKEAIPNCARQLVEKIFEESAWDFPLKTVVHSWGVNFRHLGKVAIAANEIYAGQPFFSDGLHNTLVLLCIEMIARAIRLNIYAQQRNLMKMLDQPAETPFVNIFVSKFRELANLQCWTEITNSVKSKFQVDIVSLLRSGKASQLPQKLFLIEERTHTPAMVLLLKRILRLTGCKLAPTLMTFMQKSKDSTLDFLEKLYEGDIQVIKPRVKHMSIINHSRGYFLKLEARYTAAPLYSMSQSKRFFLKSLECCPNNKITLRNLAQITLSFFSGTELLNEDAYRYFLKALIVDPGDSETLYQYGDYVNKALGLPAVAERVLLQCLEQNPLCSRAMQSLCDIYYSLGHGAAAKELSARFKKYKSSHPGTVHQRAATTATATTSPTATGSPESPPTFTTALVFGIS